ncbi:MAG: ribonuclease P protein component [Frankiaceae bacterium]
MLAARSRVRRPPEFTAVMRGGQRVGGRRLVVQLLPPTDASMDAPRGASKDALPGAPTRAGFIVGRAVGSAVVRNLVRRRLRHLVADRLDRLPPASMLVVRALPAAAGASFAALGADLDRALDRALACALDPPAGRRSPERARR